MQFKKTKIVCTIGPSSWDYPVLKKLALAGMNVARVNCSHGTPELWAQIIRDVRKVSAEIEKPIAVMADMQGPKLRLGLIDGTKEIRKGDEIHLTVNPIEEELPMQFDLSPFVKKGQTLFLNDGLIELKVVQVNSKVIITKAQNNGWVSSNKGCNAPEVNLKGASFTPKDLVDCEFALKQNVDYIALSFVQNVSDLEKPKELIKKYKSKAKIVVKIEKPQAIENLEEIIKATDAVMVARGDLAVETDPSLVPILQQKMIRISRQFQKPLIVATQMLESMTENPRATRAEVSDVANAVLDQVDAVMLSAESASGKYPVEAVATMKEVILSVEENPDYKHYIKIDWQNLSREELSLNAIASTAASLAFRIGAKAIVVGTATGRTARILSSFRPEATIIAATHDLQTLNQLGMVWGVKSMIVKPTRSVDIFWDQMIKKLATEGFAKKGDKIVLVSGSTVGVTGTTDTIKVVIV